MNEKLIKGINKILSNSKYWCPSKQEQYRRQAIAIAQSIELDEGKIIKEIIKEIHGIKYPRPHLIAKALCSADILKVKGD